MEQYLGKAHIKLEYRPQYPDLLTVKADTKVKVGNDDQEFPGWKWCKATDGREGLGPDRIALGKWVRSNRNSGLFGA